VYYYFTPQPHPVDAQHEPAAADSEEKTSPSDFTPKAENSFSRLLPLQVMHVISSS
jgi:hypothetical protein